MISKIKGKVVEIENFLVLIETKAGIFFKLYLPGRFISKINIGQVLEVYTHFYFHQENFEIYGFQNKEEYNLFKILINVSGVGAKTAFSIINFAQVNEIIKAIKEKNVDFFDQIPGLGKKTIYKIILEISSKLKSDFELKSIYLTEEDKMVFDALSSLGYKALQIKNAIYKIPKNLSIEEKIKRAIKIIK